MNKDDIKSALPLAAVIAAVLMAIVAVVGLSKGHSGAAPAWVAPTTAVNVSLIQLIATPEKFDGRRVMVTGFLVNESGDRAIYLSANDAINGLENKVAVSFQASPVPTDMQDALNREYVSLSGLFHGGSTPVLDAIDHVEERHGPTQRPPLGE